MKYLAVSLGAPSTTLPWHYCRTTSDLTSEVICMFLWTQEKGSTGAGTHHSIDRIWSSRYHDPVFSHTIIKRSHCCVSVRIHSSCPDLCGYLFQLFYQELSHLNPPATTEFLMWLRFLSTNPRQSRSRQRNSFKTINIYRVSQKSLNYLDRKGGGQYHQDLLTYWTLSMI